MYDEDENIVGDSFDVDEEMEGMHEVGGGFEKEEDYDDDPDSRFT